MSVFGHLLTPQGAPMTGVEDQAQRGDRPAKTQRTGFGNKGKGRSNGNRTSKRSSEGSETSEELVRLLARAVLRQETQLQVLKQDTSWVLFLAPKGPLEMMCKVAAEWKTQVEQKKVSHSLRVTLMSCLFAHLRNTLTKTIAGSDLYKHATAQGWIQTDKWQFQVWDTQEKCLKVDAHRPAMAHKDLLGSLDLLVKLILQPGMINRFHATKPLTPQPQGQTTFLLEVSLRCKDADQVWQALESMAGLSALQMVGLQIKKDSLRRGPLADSIQKALESYS